MDNMWISSPLTIDNVRTIELMNNVFTFFSFTGIMFIQLYTDVTIENNALFTQNQNNSIWYKNINSSFEMSGLITFKWQSEVHYIQLISNYFGDYYIDDDATYLTPMIWLNANEGSSDFIHICIAGNIFYNYVFYLNSVY
eukprot:548334_1